MSTVAEIRYAGVAIARTAALRDLTAQGCFFPLAEPMPVGSVVEIAVADRVAAVLVGRVFESADPAVAGMSLAFTDEAGPALLGLDARARSVEPPLVPAAASQPAAAVEPEPASAAAGRADADEPSTPPPVVQAWLEAEPAHPATHSDRSETAAAASTEPAPAPPEAGPPAVMAEAAPSAEAAPGRVADAVPEPAPQAPSGASPSHESGGGRRKRRRR